MVVPFFPFLFILFLYFLFFETWLKIVFYEIHSNVFRWYLLLFWKLGLLFQGVRVSGLPSTVSVRRQQWQRRLSSHHNYKSCCFVCGSPCDQQRLTSGWPDWARSLCHRWKDVSSSSMPYYWKVTLLMTLITIGCWRKVWEFWIA